MQFKSSFGNIVVAFVVTLLVGCTSTGNNVSNTLATTQPAAQQPTTVAQTDGTTSETALLDSGQSSAAESVVATQTASLANSLSFLPVEGAPQGQVTKLSRSIQEAAAGVGLSVVPSTQSAAAQYQVKGYFSALSDGSGTLLVYIWDVLDKSGNRVHRINGQERSGNITGDPWQAITDVEMKRVANNTAARLQSWVSTQ